MSQQVPVLRDYQEKAVAEIRREFKNGALRVLFVLATGGGKAVERRLRLVARLSGYRPGWIFHRLRELGEAS